MIKHSDLFGYVKQFGNYPKQETTKTEELFDNIFKKTGSKPTKQTLTKEIVNRLKLGHSGNTNSKKQLSQSKNRTGADIGSHQSQVIKSERHQNSNTNGCNPREVKSRPEQKTNGNSCTSDKSGQRVSQNATVHSDNNQRLNEARGLGILFGQDDTRKFLKINNLEYIVRSHETVQEGCRYSHHGKVVTVFSAPNYRTH